MTTAKSTSIQEQSRSYAILLQDLMKGLFAGVGWRCSKDATCIFNVLKLPPKTLGFSPWFKCRPG
jgi:hypothetical protein